MKIHDGDSRPYIITIFHRRPEAIVHTLEECLALSVTGTLFASNIDHPVYVDRGATYCIFNLAGPTADVLAIRARAILKCARPRY